ncbi:WD repeat-containing protein 65 [Monoraphidium neglectum]|uniref:WD repeat-containing protein 65 n=1 Tax=Monoraphidium neglectum TaxID=145388 RepID=A0A0D2MHN7_9CHLO|nr:WD repeat-containing protein 65 [Monoraphidium neglectum]KIZ00162.1 WD repeat-containing protein 65 [Monoraphidium neglectum]|eukprot:XP_013899181.1 WD repeat-containing protein 65 [Monoraphidium neglectum]
MLVLKLHAGPVTRLAVSYDDCLLLSAGADGAVVVMDVKDKELAKASARRDQARPEKLPWAEEVLVSKAELDERRARVTELEQQVAELTMQTEYQLRLKDLHTQERLKEVADRSNAKQEADRQKFEMLLSEKNEQARKGQGGTGRQGHRARRARRPLAVGGGSGGAA